MFHRLIALFFIVAMVQSTVYVSFAQYKGYEISVVIIEEEEHSNSEHSTKSGEKTYEFLYDFNETATISMSQDDGCTKLMCYFVLHHKDSDLNPPLVNPPEV